MKIGISDATVYLHRLVWEHVNEAIPIGCEIDHINGDKQDNRIENLKCLTKTEHAKKTGESTKKKNNNS
jgi:hypothetical protein